MASKQGATTASSAQRGTRVPRNTLSRAAIVEAALTLVDAEGLPAVTMPRLAQRLGVGTMSLYRHIEDKDDLLDAVAARALSEVAVPDGAPGDWEGRVIGYLRALRDEALTHPALFRILAERGVTVAPVFDQLEEVHRVLRSAGFTDTDAVRAFYSLLSYVLGFVLWELPRVHRQAAADYAAAWNDAVDRLDPDRYPNLRALRQPLSTTASTEQFEYGLTHLVESLRQARPAARRRPRSRTRRDDGPRP
jgi:TetR/AcrR family transcriptional regulator, tetracycline repressor protein